MDKEEKLSALIEVYGFEHSYVILFADLCEERAEIGDNNIFLEQLFCHLIGHADKYKYTKD